MRVYRLIRIEGRGLKRKTRVFWVKAPNARAVSNFVPPKAGARETIEVLAESMHWAREGIVLDTDAGGFLQ